MTESSILPPWLVNWAEFGWRVLAILVSLVVFGYIATMLWTIIAAIVLSIVVAAVLSPSVLRLREKGQSRNRAAGTVWAVVIVGGLIMLIFLAVAFLPYVGDLVSTWQTTISQAQAELAELGAPEWIGTFLSQATALAVDDAGDELLGDAANVVTVLILATFLLFFFLRDGDRAWAWIFENASSEKREVITGAGADALARVGGYLRGTTVLAGTVALTDLLFMVVLGVPMAGPLAVLVFLGGYVPYFGGIVTAFVVLLVTYESLGAQATVVMIALMGVRGVIVSYLIRPTVYGKTVRIHPALVLVVLPAGYELGGTLGLFAAVPITAVVLATAEATITIIKPERGPSLPRLVPAWFDRMAQFSWRALIAIAIVALCVNVLAHVPLAVAPIALAVIVTCALEPAVAALMRRGRTRGRAAAIVVVGGFAAIVGLLLLAFVSLFEQVDEVASTASGGASEADEAASGQLGLLTDTVESGRAATVQTVEQLSGAVPALVTVTIISTLLTFYFLRDGGDLWRRIAGHASPGVREAIDGAARKAFDVLGGYVVGTTAISFVGAASQFAIMVLLGLPLALPVFVLSFILGFIPYIGSLISTLLAFLIAVAAGSTSDVVVMGIWTLVFNIVQGNVVSPLVYGRTVNLHPAVVLVAIPAGSAIAGVFGMFLVVPVLAVVAATWRTVLALTGDQDESRTSVDPRPDMGAATRKPSDPDPEVMGSDAS